MTGEQKHLRRELAEIELHLANLQQHVRRVEIERDELRAKLPKRRCRAQKKPHDGGAATS